MHALKAAALAIVVVPALVGAYIWAQVTGKEMDGFIR
jgi:hypothetical protein